MDYFVECPCGKRVPVTAVLAGTTVQCQCTRSLAVPRLSELRQSAGQGKFEAGIVDTVRRMISEGTLPPTRECALTGLVTDDIVKIRVECERVWKRGPGKGRWAFAVFSVLILPFWPVWALLSWALLDERREDLGHNIVVQLPLRVCGECHSRLRRLSQRRIRRLLREVPVYAQLLAEYPGARVSVADGKSQ